MIRLRAHKLLLIIYGIAIVFAAYEISHPRMRGTGTDDPRWFLAPDSNIVDVSVALYPERSTSLYYRAFQASLCEAEPADSRTACRKRGPVAAGEVRELIERALATGNRSLELAMYNYAMILLHEGASDEEIDAAIRSWRVSHANSTRPDPRVAFAKRNRSRARRR